ncbi:hypothetical protein [Prochlorococcus marinus]|uniref:hypothetical protein n=1 Tax=Prochlorococcus marinus TaxID=1219 RepID=UPI0022B5ACE5|nr:hypothetical protein [Prochlorococcus marinus]
MKNNKLEKNLERARIHLYNVLAILIVIIPEYLAELIYTIEVSQHKAILPNEGDAWETETELRLSKLNIYELRLMAKSLCIHGYSNENKNSLIRRINRKTKKRIKWKSLKIQNIRKTL